MGRTEPALTRILVRLAAHLTTGALLCLATHPLGAQVPGEVRGHVLDARTGQPVGGAHVDVVGQSDYAESGLDGTFVLRGLEPRRYTIRVRAIGYAPGSADVEIENGRAATVDVALQPVIARLGTVLVQAAADTGAPGAVAFDRRAIETSGRRDVGELLQGAPGVVVTQSGGPGSPSTVSIRGSGANEVLVLLDGVPLNSVITGEADLSRVPLATVERVTVIPGAQSARYGGRALAGVVLIETRRTERDLSATAGIGTWGERDAGLSLGATHPGDASRAGASLVADYRTIRGDFPYAVPVERGGGTARRTNADATTGSVLAAASLDGEHGSVRVRGEWEHTSRGLAGSIEQPSATGRERDSHLAGGADARWQHGSFTWAANADLTHEAAAYIDPDPPFGGAYDDSVDANALTLSSTGTLAGPAGSAVIGADTRTLHITSTMLTPGAPVTQHLYGTWAALHASRTVARDLTLAGDAAVRVDWDPLLPGATASPHVGLTLSRGILSLSTSLGRGYTPPSLADEFFHEGVLVRPNPSLQPERVRDDLQARLGVHDVRAGVVMLGADFAAYRADIDGMILWLPDYRFVWSPSNFDVRRTGWDASAHAAVPAIGVDVHGTVSATDISYAGPVLTGQVAYRPRTTATITAGVTHAGAHLEVTTQYVGARRTVAGSPLNVLAPYWLTNAAFTVPLARTPWNTEATVGVDNAFDRAAAMLVDYPFPGRTWTVALRVRRGDDRYTDHAPPGEP